MESFKLFRNVASVTLLVLLVFVEASSAYTYFSTNGVSELVYYGEVILLLGPWSYLISQPSFESVWAFGFVVFVFPALIAAGYLFMLNIFAKGTKVIPAITVTLSIVVLHLFTGANWYLTKTSWGP